jgi:hypothetical protein
MTLKSRSRFRRSKIPYKNEHAARVVEPSEFIKTTFRRKEISPGASIIVAKLKGSGRAGPMKVQAFRFNVCEFTATEAKRWLKYYKVKTLMFEKASGKCIRRGGA